MLPTSPLVDLFVNQTQQANAMPTSPWQQELMATVNPEKLKQQNIAQAIAKASQALATTPGNFLTGASAAAGAGATSYLDGQQQNDMQRTAALRQIEEAQRGDQDQRLRRLAAAIGIQQGEDNTIYNRERDAVGDERWTVEQAGRDEDRAERRRIADENLKIRREQNAELNKWRAEKVLVDRKKAQIRKDAGGDPVRETGLRLRAIHEDIMDYRKLLDSFQFSELTPDEKNEALKQREIELMQFYGIDPATRTMTDGGATPPTPAPASPPPAGAGAPGKTDKGDAAAKPKPSDALQQARDAIARGANPDAVRQRLIENGYDASGL